MVDQFGRIKKEPDGHSISVQGRWGKIAVDEQLRYLLPIKFENEFCMTAFQLDVTKTPDYSSNLYSRACAENRCTSQLFMIVNKECTQASCLLDTNLIYDIGRNVQPHYTNHTSALIEKVKSQDL